MSYSEETDGGFYLPPSVSFTMKQAITRKARLIACETIQDDRKTEGIFAAVFLPNTAALTENSNCLYLKTLYTLFEDSYIWSRKSLQQEGTIIAVAWYYHDEKKDVRYYTESYNMSVTEFAEVVSGIVGYKVSASDTSQAQRWSDLERFRNIKHI